MNNNLTPQEETFKSKANELSFDINTDDLWASVEPQLPPQKKKRRVAIWFFLSGLAIALISLFWMVNPNENSIAQHTEEINKTIENKESTKIAKINESATQKSGEIKPKNETKNIKNDEVREDRKIDQVIIAKTIQQSDMNNNSYTRKIQTQEKLDETKIINTISEAQTFDNFTQTKIAQATILDQSKNSKGVEMLIDKERGVISILDNLPVIASDKFLLRKRAIMPMSFVEPVKVVLWRVKNKIAALIMRRIFLGFLQV